MSEDDARSFISVMTDVLALLASSSDYQNGNSFYFSADVSYSFFTLG